MADYSIFNDAEQEYKRLSDTLRARVSECGDTPSPGDVRNMENDLKSAQSFLRTMDMEARSFPAGDRREFSSKVTLYRSVLADIKKDVSALRSKADRGALFSGPDGVEMTESRSHREWLLSTQDKHAATNETLASALRTVADTEDVAIGITGELARNRETILSAQRKARETTSMTYKARKLVQNMRKRTMMQKLMLCFFIFVMLGVIVFILYFAFFNSSSSDSSKRRLLLL